MVPTSVRTNLPVSMGKGSILVRTSQVRASMQFKRRMAERTLIREEPLSIRQEKGMYRDVSGRPKVYSASVTARYVGCKYSSNEEHLSYGTEGCRVKPAIS